MKKNYQNQDPRIITCKFDSICKESGKPIKKGEQALYYPLSKSIFSLDTKQAQEFRQWKFDISLEYKLNDEPID